MALRKTAFHLLSSIHRYLKKCSLKISNISDNFGVCASQFCVSSSPKVWSFRKEPSGPPVGYLLPSHRTTQRPTTNTGSVQSFCCDDYDLLRCDGLLFRTGFPTFRMNVFQRLLGPCSLQDYVPWRQRELLRHNYIPEHLGPQQYRFENLILLRYKKYFAI